MGANNNSKVAALAPKVGGGVYRAPAGTALPTDASTALPAAYKCLGAVSDGGVKPSRDISTTKVKEWNGKTLAVLTTDQSLSYEFLLLSVMDTDTLGFVFGTANVTVTAPTASAGTKVAIQDKGGTPDNCVLVFDTVFGGKKIRKIVPNASPTIAGEEAYATGNLAGYTINAEATDDASGVRLYEYSEDTDKTA